MDSLPRFAWSRMTSIDTGFQSCRTTDSVRAAILTSTLQLKDTTLVILEGALRPTGSTPVILEGALRPMESKKNYTKPYEKKRLYIHFI